ncbi:hypothetical protein PTSG_10020 [Salpingoeca rosetta]|uniref:Uncharacterized protein n=1 Tax=Salpingoeca rosetta (strain ATCC 50818 / BSB-021) TaxID=946362 RepID=F2UP99_SALR5|nr:uncharacterized protein PTSG_10020 [Salpingoeca rosetta]EGD79454.1 hypothetical protein PTSG_10020 [Salpingoeca rosetta]|eukprot:XP_004988935.1 hypothetical protein PTSG_10020 [Salpingoeca rosetta]
MMAERRASRRSFAVPKSRGSARRSPSPQLPLSRKLDCNIAEALVKGAPLQDIADILTSSPNQAAALDRYQRHPLELAAIHNRQDVMEVLLQRNMNINTKGPQGYAAIHRACMWGHKDMVQFLLDYGADPT